MRDLWIRMARGEKTGPAGTLLLIALLPLEWLFRAGFAVYMGLERLGLRRRDRLPVRTVSIGNLTLGGTGKTSVVEVLASRLSERQKTAVLLRGYGGQAVEEGLLVSDGRRMHCSWEACGDEAALLAQKLPEVAVLTGRDRRRSGARAVNEQGAELVLLDDGLQYWQLARDLDIVLLDARSPLGNGHVMPAGMLREPAGGLARAHVVILTHTNEVSGAKLAAAQRTARRFAPQARQFLADYVACQVYRPEAPPLDAEWLRGRQVMALCGIGSPDSFVCTLQNAGAVVRAEMFFPDHHPFSQTDMDNALDAAESAGVQTIITTEKDAVRLKNLRIPDNLYILHADFMITELQDLLALVVEGSE